MTDGEARIRAVFDKVLKQDHDEKVWALLRTTLQAAVPIHIAKIVLEMRNLPDPFPRIQEAAAECAQYIAEHGDVLLYPSKKPGGTAKAFNYLARGIACGSFALGGITFLGDHWETK